MEKEDENLILLRKNIEDLMSDNYLQKNQKLYNEIKNSDTSLIPIKLLLEERKVKYFKANLEDIIKSLRNSAYLVMDEKEENFGRVNKHLPKIRNKTIYVTLDKNYKKFPKEIEMGKRFIYFVPIVLNFKSKKKLRFRKKNFKKVFEKKYDRILPYYKLFQKKGTIVFNEKDEKDLEFVNKLLANPDFDFNENTFRIRKMGIDETKKWFSINKSNIEKELKIQYNAAVKKDKKIKKEVRNYYHESYGPFKMFNNNFENFKVFKKFLINIMEKTENGKEISTEYDSLKNFFEEKNDIKLIIDAHNIYKFSKCFYIVNNINERTLLSLDEILSKIYYYLKESN